MKLRGVVALSCLALFSDVPAINPQASLVYPRYKIAPMHSVTDMVTLRQNVLDVLEQIQTAPIGEITEIQIPTQQAFVRLFREMQDGELEKDVDLVNRLGAFFITEKDSGELSQVIEKKILLLLLQNPFKKVLQSNEEIIFERSCKDSCKKEVVQFKWDQNGVKIFFDRIQNIDDELEASIQYLEGGRRIVWQKAYNAKEASCTVDGKSVDVKDVVGQMHNMSFSLSSREKCDLKTSQRVFISSLNNDDGQGIVFDYLNSQLSYPVQENLVGSISIFRDSHKGREEEGLHRSKISIDGGLAIRQQQFDKIIPVNGFSVPYFDLEYGFGD